MQHIQLKSSPLSKWLIYQRERFPFAQYGVMALAFSYSGLCLSIALRSASGLPDFKSVLVASVTTFLFFFQLRVADEFKDHADDCKYQPERPVPRGLITLPELAIAGAMAAAAQIGFTLWLDVALLPLLLAAWCYFALMSVEFFMKDFLRSRPVLYLVSHMPILLFIDAYITACDWLVKGGTAPTRLVLFLAISFLNGTIVEIGRKLRAPSDERVGVETYTALWGTKPAITGWLAVIVASGALATVIGGDTGALPLVLTSVTCLSVTAVITAAKFVEHPSTRLAGALNNLSSVWVLGLYLCLGTIPAITRSILSCLH